LDGDRTWDEESAINYLSDQCGAGDKNTVLISATRGWGLTKLLKLISGTLAETAQPV